MTTDFGFAAPFSLNASMPRYRIDAHGTVRVGFIGPLTGDVSAWGLPGRDGCLIWISQVNALGGIRIDDKYFKVELISFDDEYDPARARLGARKLILEDDVKFIMMLGGDTFPAVVEFANEHKMLTSTLLPSDLSPDTPYTIAPCEVHPIYNVTGVEWLRENRPELKRVALCAQDDSLGLPSLATYRAAFEVAGIDLVREVLFPGTTTDLAPIVADMLAAKPDILCWDTAYEPFVRALTEQAYQQGFRGQIISCTCDDYRELVQSTSPEFMEGFVFQFPDFDDPMLNMPQVNFSKPNEFYQTFNDRYPGSWSAVSWEYASILDLWRSAVEMSGTFEPRSVLAAMKAGGTGKHAFGEARWWGKELFGIDNALVGNWPVVVIRGGKARIAEFRSIPEWWDRNGSVLLRHMRSLNQMWDQRVESMIVSGRRPAAGAMAIKDRSRIR